MCVPIEVFQLMCAVYLIGLLSNERTDTLSFFIASDPWSSAFNSFVQPGSFIFAVRALIVPCCYATTVNHHEESGLAKGKGRCPVRTRSVEHGRKKIDEKAPQASQGALCHLSVQFSVQFSQSFCMRSAIANKT